MAKNNGHQRIERNTNGNVDNFSNEELRAREEAKAGIDNLRQTTIDSSLSTASTKSDLTVEQTGLEHERDIHSLEGFLSVLDKLLQEIEDIKSGTSKKGLSKAGKKGMDNAKAKLKQYEKQIKAKKKAKVKEKNPQITEEEIEKTKEYWQKLRDIRIDVGMGQWGENSNTASFLYNSPEYARKSNKRQAKNLKFNQEFQGELREGAISHISNGNVEKANEFYRKVAQGEYDQANYQLLTPNSQGRIIAIPRNPRGNPEGYTTRGGRVERTRTSINYSNLDRGEAFQQGGIVGIIDKGLSNCKNMTPGQRNTWKSIAVLGGFAAGIYGLYKFFTNKKMGFWSKALTTGGVIFASQALTGESPIALFQRLLTGGFTKEYLESRFGNLFGDAVSGLGNSGIESSNTITPAMYSMMIFNPSTNVGEIRKMTSEFENPNEWKVFRQGAISKLKTKYGEQSAEYFSATFPEKFDKQNWLNRLASFGVTDGVANNIKIYELANNASTNEIILEKFKEENGLKVNPAKKKELDDYMDNLKSNNQAINITTLADHKDWFKEDLEATYTDRPKDRENIKALEAQVEALSLDPSKKSELKIAIKRFYDERSIESKPNPNDFDLKIKDNFLVLTSHGGYESKIDINKYEIVDFGNGITFANLDELLNTADLANKILESQKGKTPKGLPAFQYKGPTTIFENGIGKKGRGIYFNDAEWGRNLFDFDTRVLSGGWGGTIGKIDTLCKRPEDFAKYLSDRWEKDNKRNINIEAYPILKRLSDSGIIFMDKQEVKQAEIRLNKVKELRSMANKGTPGYEPFSIEGNKLVFSTSDTKNATKLYFPDQFPNDFPGKSQNLSNFPTILNNKDKFLDFMNDYNNGMRGSKLKNKNYQ